MSSIEAAVVKTDQPDRGRSSALRSYLLIAPSVIWMALFLVLPLAMIVYVSFWTQSTF
jgi:putative spermidine/putrescine transport system permease protein